MNVKDRALEILRIRPLEDTGWFLWLRVLLAGLPLVIVLLDVVGRDALTPPVIGNAGAFGIVLTCVALITHHAGQRHLVRWISLVAVVLAGFSVVQAGHFSAPLAGHWPQPGGFLWSLLPLFSFIVAIALLVGSYSARRQFRSMLNICLGIGIVALTLVGVLGEAYEMVRWFELDEATTRTLVTRGTVGVALGAALGLGVTPLGLSLMSLRRWAHVAATVAVLFLAIMLAALLRLEEIRDLSGAVQVKSEQVIERLDSQFRLVTYELRRLARSATRQGEVDAETRDAEVWKYVDSTPELRALAHVDTTFAVEWSVPSSRFPEVGPGRQLDRSVPEAAKHSGRFSAEPVVSAPLDMPNLGRVFVYLVPTLDGRMTDGFMTGFFHIETFVDRALGRSDTRFGVVVQDQHGRLVHAEGREDLGVGVDYAVSRDWNIPGTQWRVHVFPRREMLRDGFTVMPLLILVLGTLLAVTFGVTLYQAAFARVSMRRLQREVQRRARLETELRRYQRNLEEQVAQRTRELEERNRELKRLARTDALTGVLNRGRFEEQFEAMLTRAQRYRRPLTVCLFDLDHFKQINDTHGHAVGDEVLQQVCSICRPILRDADVFARYGGEEFAILMDEADLETALQVAERMRATLEATPVVLANGLRVNVTGSFGLAALTAEIEGRKALLKQADQALYRAKAAGRNRVEAWQVDATC